MTEAAGATRLPDPKRRTRLFLVVFLLVFINLPLVHSEWQLWKIEHRGVEVTAEVVDTDVFQGGRWLSFVYPPEVETGEDQEFRYPAEVDVDTWEAARESGEIRVRYLEDQASAYRVEGQQRQYLGWYLTLGGDLIVIVILLLARRYGGRRRPLPLRVAAIGDVERCPPGGLLEQVEGDLYLVRGEVSEIDEDEIVLDLGDRDVVVVLDGHTNPVGYQQPAQVRGRLLT